MDNNLLNNPSLHPSASAFGSLFSKKKKEPKKEEAVQNNLTAEIKPKEEPKVNEEIKQAVSSSEVTEPRDVVDEKTINVINEETKKDTKLFEKMQTSNKQILNNPMMPPSVQGLPSLLSKADETGKKRPHIFEKMDPVNKNILNNPNLSIGIQKLPEHLTMEKETTKDNKIFEEMDDVSKNIVNNPSLPPSIQALPSSLKLEEKQTSAVESSKPANKPLITVSEPQDNSSDAKAGSGFQISNKSFNDIVDRVARKYGIDPNSAPDKLALFNSFPNEALDLTGKLFEEEAKRWQNIKELNKKYNPNNDAIEKLPNDSQEILIGGFNLYEAERKKDLNNIFLMSEIKPQEEYQTDPLEGYQQSQPEPCSIADQVNSSFPVEKSIENVTGRIKDLDDQKNTRVKSLENEIENQKSKLSSVYDNEINKSNKELQDIFYFAKSKQNLNKENIKNKYQEKFANLDKEVSEKTNQISQKDSEIKGKSGEIENSRANIAELESKFNVNDVESSASIKAKIHEYKSKIKSLETQKQQLIEEKRQLEQSRKDALTQKSEESKNMNEMLSKETVSADELRSKMEAPVANRAKINVARLKDIRNSNPGMTEHKNINEWNNELKNLKSNNSEFDIRKNALTKELDKFITQGRPNQGNFNYYQNPNGNRFNYNQNFVQPGVQQPQRTSSTFVDIMNGIMMFLPVVNTGLNAWANYKRMDNYYDFQDRMIDRMYNFSYPSPMPMFPPMYGGGFFGAGIDPGVLSVMINQNGMNLGLQSTQFMTGMYGGGYPGMY